MFIALLTSLPTRNSTVRMRVWRALKTTGCGVLRDGVYVLPAGAAAAAGFARAEAEVKAAGGFAMTIELSLRTPQQEDHVRRLFDRGAAYGALVKRVSEAKGALRRLGKRKAGTLVQRLRRSFEELAGIDYFPGQARAQAKNALSALEGEAHGLFAGGEPRAAKARVRRRDPLRYHDRVWATRRDLWVDRLASAWLIRRFIDRNARFVWLGKPSERAKGAVGFDFDGAEFTHVEGRVTFEVLAQSFGLEGDPALTSIGHAVRFLDAGGIPVADAKGLETLLKGIKAKAGADDDATLAQAIKVFDLFYAAYARPQS